MLPTAPALHLAVLSPGNAVTLVRDLALPGSSFICSLNTAHNQCAEQDSGALGISCPLDIHPEVDPAGGGDTAGR